MATPKPRVKVPEGRQGGEVITHQDADQPQDGIGPAQGQGRQAHPAQDHQQVHCEFNGKPVFSCDIEPAISANPYFEFNAKVAESGTFEFTWVDDDGTVYSTEAEDRSELTERDRTGRGSRMRRRPRNIGRMTVKKLPVAVAIAADVIVPCCPVAAQADPVDDKLVIDGEEMITRAPAPEGHPFDEVLSGWLYREAGDPGRGGRFVLQSRHARRRRGEEIWNTVDGTAGKSCASCHGDAAESMKGVGAHYPKWDAKAKRPIDVELQINECRDRAHGRRSPTSSTRRTRRR